MIQVETVNQFTPTQEQIDELQKAIASYPQVVPGTEHFFVEGLYGRKVLIPAGLIVVGKTHKSHHFFICLSGKAAIWTEEGTFGMVAGDVHESIPGARRVVYAVEDCIVMTVHKSTNLELAELEKELMEDDPNSLFDADNRPKEGVSVWPG